jgi:HEAT repeat protein
MRTLVVGLMLAGSIAWAQETPPALRRRLTAIDTPPTRAQLVELTGRNTAMTLRALASATTESITVRRAALSALGHFDEPATRATLARLTVDSVPTVRKAAVETLGFLPPASGRDEALLRALADEDAMVRRSAIRALARSTDVEIRAALSKRALVELDVETRAMLEQALRR